MNRSRRGNLRFAPWIRAAVAIYVTLAVAVVALHQHHDGLRGHDCALCTVAHTPGVVPHTATVPVLTRTADPTPILLSETLPDVEPLGPPSSRAPPRS